MTARALVAILISALCTLSMRALPFLLLGRNRLGKEQCGVCIAFHGVHKALDALYQCLILSFGFIPRCCYTGHRGDCPLIHAERIIQQLFLRARHPRFTLAGNFLDL